MKKSLIFLILLSIGNCFAANQVVNLTAAYKTVNFTGTPAKAIALNDQIPGPSLHFKEGDHVTINVYNKLDKGTAVHWHGILLPWKMDGVEHVTQPPIPPGGVFHYEFTIKQSGTYWYHAHAGFQEQQGLFGALIIDPATPTIQSDKDFVIVLSDWNNNNPEQTYANLKKDGDYYSPKFPLQPSLSHFLSSYHKGTEAERSKLKEAYSMMQTMRMSPYDISDVAYDTFLLNGKTKSQPWKGKVKVGDIVRLRFIDAGGSAMFRIKIPGEIMRVVQVDGNDIKPYQTNDLFMAPGETYDVLVKISHSSPHYIYAESADKVGAAYGALVTDRHTPVDFSSIKPFPEPEPVIMMMHHDMATNHHEMSHHDMTMSPHEMPHHEIKMTSPVKTKYDLLSATTKTNNPNKPYQTIEMRLSGHMGHYIWFLNGVPEYKAHPILIEPGKRYRLVFINETMMHHPMHLHGHWMIMRNGHGAYDPKLHTIDMPPNAVVTADFDADARDGYWYFHCHNLYHMMAGMANIVEYKNTSSHMHGKVSAHPARWFMGNYVDIGADPSSSFGQMTYKMLFGPDYNKLELFMNDAEMKHGSIENADMDIFYWHLIDQFWALKGGVNYFYRPAKTPYWQPGIGIEGLAPYFIDTNIRGYYRAGSFKLDVDLTRDTQLFDNFFIRLEARGIAATKTLSRDDIGSGFNELQLDFTPFYRLLPGLSLFLQFEHEQYYGKTKRLISNNNGETNSNTTTVGIEAII